MLYNLEGWNKQTKKELKKLEQVQAKALCQLLEVPRSTPYIGLLHELGMWKMEERIGYRRAMLVQNILKSDDRRLTKRVIKEQKEEDEDDDTIYRTTKDHLDKYGININEIANMEKSKLKKLLKDKINEEMKKMVEKAAGNMTKLRFIKVDNFERQKYIYELKGHECIQAIKTRLNMLPIYGNYKSNLTLNKMCRYCNQQEIR